MRRGKPSRRARWATEPDPGPWVHMGPFYRSWASESKTTSNDPMRRSPRRKAYDEKPARGDRDTPSSDFSGPLPSCAHATTAGYPIAGPS
jgi:hypothetical protein